MQDTFTQAGRVAWDHILPPATLLELTAPDRWNSRDGPDVLVAELGGEVVGFVCLRASGDDDATPAIGEIDACYLGSSGDVAGGLARPNARIMDSLKERTRSCVPPAGNRVIS
jgi:hypothetical protein